MTRSSGQVVTLQVARGYDRYRCRCGCAGRCALNPIAKNKRRAGAVQHSSAPGVRATYALVPIVKRFLLPLTPGPEAACLPPGRPKIPCLPTLSAFSQSIASGIPGAPNGPPYLVNCELM